MELERSGAPGIEHALFQSLDRKASFNEPNERYKVDRGVVDVWQKSFLDFDFFAHIDGLLEANPSRQIRILEGGCGVGRTLEDLKRGIVVDGRITPDHPFDPENISEWKRSLLGRKIPGFGNKIHTTGVTLTEEHAQVASWTPTEHEVDRMIVGTLESYDPAEQFDFVFDFMGPARYFPDVAVPKYAEIMRSGANAFMRFEVTSQGVGEVERLIQENGLSIVAFGMPNFDDSSEHRPQVFLDVLFQRN